MSISGSILSLQNHKSKSDAQVFLKSSLFMHNHRRQRSLLGLLRFSVVLTRRYRLGVKGKNKTRAIRNTSVEEHSLPMCGLAWVSTEKYFQATKKHSTWSMKYDILAA